MALTIGMIGYGEVGSTFACDLLARGVTQIATYDILFDGADTRAAIWSRAQSHGVVPRGSLEAALEGANIVMSAVTADAALDVASQAAHVLRRGQIFLDLNSASPATKCLAAKAVEASGADYVEGAVMAPVAEPRLAVQILGGGPAAERTATLLNPLGMNIRPVAVEHGRASAMKLCRSIMIKGLEALIIDCDDASKRWGVQDEVFESLSKTFPSIDWPALSKTMRARVERHGRRRAAEMREAGDMMNALILDRHLCDAIAAKHEAVAAKKKASAGEG